MLKYCFDYGVNFCNPHFLCESIYFTFLNLKLCYIPYLKSISLMFFFFLHQSLHYPPIKKESATLPPVRLPCSVRGVLYA